jgi:cytochrome P450
MNMITKTANASESKLRQPPTAPGLPLIGNAIRFMTSKGLPIEFMGEAAARYGDIVRFKVGNQSIYLVSAPDLVHEILVKRATEFHKAPVGFETAKGLGRFLGTGILTADHEEWRPQRKLIQPLMHTKHIASYADTMAHFGQKLMDIWGDSAERDIYADMMQVTMWIIAETMFGADVTHTPALAAADHDAQAITVADVQSPLPDFMTHGRDRQAVEVNKVLTDVVERFMDERRAQGNPERSDLLSLLMETRDEDGNPVSDEYVRNNILTLFLAGHETTANTLTWTFRYLDQNPDVLAKLQQEVDTVLGGRLPTFGDLPNLPYTLMVIKETMRIEPTVSAFPRFIGVDTAVGDYQLQSGSTIFISPYVLHHDPRWWSQPDQFDPNRFSAENEPNIPKYA